MTNLVFGTKKIVNDDVTDAKHVQIIQIPPPSSSQNNLAPQHNVIISKGQLIRHT